MSSQNTENHEKTQKKSSQEASVQVKEFQNSGLQTIEFYEESSSQSYSLTETPSLKAWFQNFGSDMSPAELLKNNKALYLKLIQNQYPHHSVFHLPLNKKSHKHEPKTPKHKNSNKKNKRVHILSPRIEELSTPKK